MVMVIPHRSFLFGEAVIRHFKPVAFGGHPNLLGHADVLLPRVGLIFRDVAISSRDGKYFAKAPRRACFSGGAFVRDEEGGVRYSQCVDFESRSLYIAFSEATIAALRITRPEVFIEPPGAPLPAAVHCAHRAI